MIAAALFKVFDFFANNKWARMALIVVLAILTLGLYIHGREKRAVERVQQKYREDALKEQAKVETTRRTIEESRNADIEQAREAGRSLPPFSGPSELWDKSPDVAGELFGNRADGSGQATRR